MAIERIEGTFHLPRPSPLPTDGPTPEGSFGEALGRLVAAVETSATEANGAVDRMMNKTGDVHDAMIALQQADITLQFAVQVRNKLVQAYQEIMRMPV